MSSLICVGDFGTGQEGQLKVAELMKYLIELYNCKLILGLGDNIYPDGVSSSKDPQFFTKFEEPYKDLPKNIKFYNVLGNHDYHQQKSPKSEIKYSKLNKQWVLPHNFYCFKRFINNVPVDFIALDTNLRKLKNKKEQKKWLTNTILESKSAWNIVYGHHPWKSFGEHGHAEGELDTFYQEMVDETNGKIDLLISGHDHNQQHIFIPNNPNMIVSGVGGQTRPMKSETGEGLLYSSSNLGCCLIEVYKGKLVINFFNTNKEKEYSFIINKK